MVDVVHESLGKTRRDTRFSSGCANRESTLHEMAAEPAPLSFNRKVKFKFHLFPSGTKGHEVAQFQI
jgi:hypothetical protein